LIGLPREGVIRLVLIGAAFFGLATAASAELLVIARAGPSAAQYPIGRRLPDNHRFALRQGDRVTLLHNGGGRVTLRGPGVGTATLLLAQGRGRDENAPATAQGVR
jgi:hypothetical protein